MPDPAALSVSGSEPVGPDPVGCGVGGSGGASPGVDQRGRCLRWAGRRGSWRQPDGGFDPDRYRVAALEEAPAKAFVVTHHYSGTYPAARFRYGMWDRRRDALVGVSVLGVPAQARVLSNVFPTLEVYRESVELARFVLLDEVPANAESWFLARAFALAADAGVRGVVSFSDPVPRPTPAGDLVAGHVGIIYQASNATYLGRASPATVTLLPDGAVLSNRAVSKLRSGERGRDYVVRSLVARGARPLGPGDDPMVWLAGALDDVGAVKFRHPGNHRYAFTLGSRTQRRAVVVRGDRARYPKLPDPSPAVPRR